MIKMMVALASGMVSCVVFAGNDGHSLESRVANAMLAFDGGEWSGALSEFEQAARSGNAQAQLKLAEMYETGAGVPRNYVHAYAWYNAAAGQGNVLARSRRDTLETKMTKSQVATSQQISRSLFPDGAVANNDGTDTNSKTLSLGYTFGLYSGQPFSQTDFVAYRPNATALQMVRDILSFNSIPSQSFNVMATPQVPNAAAGIQQSERYILYNPQFMQQVAAASATPWEAYSIMAHEIGHHLAGHTIKPGGSRPNFELEADLFSGGTLARMGASLDQAIAAMQKIGSPTGSLTHPPRDQRVAAITQGWNQAKSQMGGAAKPDAVSASTRVRKPDAQPAPQAMSVATSCVTSFGECRLVMPLWLGSPCTCFMPKGMYPGVAK